MAASAPVTRPRTTSQSLIPPEEKFWQRYSPHSEAPLSGVTSTVLHLLALGLLLLIIYVHSMTNIEDEARSLPVDVIKMGGGGGNPNGGGPGPAGPDGGDPDGPDNPDRPMGPLPPAVQDINPNKVEGINQDFNHDPTAEYYAKEGKGSTSFNALGSLEADARQALRKSVNPGAGGGGMGGSGRDGGRDSGKDTGMGAGTGPGKGGSVITVREKRVLRWAMTFNTSDGKDYLRQLTGLGAKIGIPVEGHEGQFLLVNDLKNPTVAEPKDVTKLGLIYWIDNKPESVQSLFSVLPSHQPSQPPYFVAFFPKRIEDRLLDLEMDFASRRYNGLKDEDKIHETKFDVFKSGASYDVRVNMVYLKR